MAQASGRFQYDRIQDRNEIRLARLLPTQNTSNEIYLELRHTLSSETSDEYVAISYMWGDKAAHKPIYIRQSSGAWGELMLGRNAWSFLHHEISIQRSNMWFWMDAICIDQSNMVEKSHQVARMANIFSRAEKVLIWMPFLGEVPVPKTVTNSTSRTEYDDWLICEIVSNEYWTRLWIVQEVILARSVFIIAGLKLIDIQHLKRIVFPTWPHLEAQLERRVEPFNAILYHSSLGSSCKDLPSVLRRFDKQVCTERRDRIYGLLGLVDIRYLRCRVSYGRVLSTQFYDQDDEDTLLVDYECAIEEVLVRTLRYCQSLGTQLHFRDVILFAETLGIELDPKIIADLALKQDSDLRIIITPTIDLQLEPVYTLNGNQSGEPDQYTIKYIRSHKRLLASSSPIEFESDLLDQDFQIMLCEISGMNNLFVVDTSTKDLSLITIIKSDGEFALPQNYASTLKVYQRGTSAEPAGGELFLRCSLADLTIISGSQRPLSMASQDLLRLIETMIRLRKEGNYVILSRNHASL